MSRVLILLFCLFGAACDSTDAGADLSGCFMYGTGEPCAAGYSCDSFEHHCVCQPNLQLLCTGPGSDFSVAPLRMDFALPDDGGATD